jgi:hypothetical protein
MVNKFNEPDQAHAWSLPGAGFTSGYFGGCP